MGIYLCFSIEIFGTVSSPTGTGLSQFGGFIWGDVGLLRTTLTLSQPCCWVSPAQWVSWSLGFRRILIAIDQHPLLFLSTGEFLLGLLGILLASNPLFFRLLQQLFWPSLSHPLYCHPR